MSLRETLEQSVRLLFKWREEAADSAGFSPSVALQRANGAHAAFTANS